MPQERQEMREKEEEEERSSRALHFREPEQLLVKALRKTSTLRGLVACIVPSICEPQRKWGRPDWGERDHSITPILYWKL